MWQKGEEDCTVPGGLWESMEHGHQTSSQGFFKKDSNFNHLCNLMKALSFPMPTSTSCTFSCFGECPLGTKGNDLAIIWAIFSI